MHHKLMNPLFWFLLVCDMNTQMCVCVWGHEQQTCRVKHSSVTRSIKTKPGRKLLAEAADQWTTITSSSRLQLEMKVQLCGDAPERTERDGNKHAWN